MGGGSEEKAADRRVGDRRNEEIAMKTQAG